MFFGSFAGQNLVPEEDARWLFDAFAWSLAHFGRDVFFDETVLVVPDNAHFPDGQTAQRYGRAHFRPRAALRGDGTLAPATREAVRVRNRTAAETGDPRRPSGIQGHTAVGTGLVRRNRPDIRSGSGRQSRGPDRQLRPRPCPLPGADGGGTPPGGAAYWPRATEVVAAFMGFGLMFANSAFTVPVRSCGKAGASRRRFSHSTLKSTCAGHLPQRSGRNSGERPGPPRCPVCAVTAPSISAS